MNKPRFLITSADQRTWSKEFPVLFLGEWCRWNDKEGYWDGVDAKIAPPYGIKKYQKKDDCYYINDLYELLLIELSQNLNEVHSVNRSVRYWRILIGTWLHRFITISFNRWQTIQYAVDNYKIKETIIVEVPDFELVPLDYLGFANLNRVGNWDAAITACIIKEYTDIKYKVINVIDNKNIQQSKFTFKPKSTFKNKFKSMLVSGNRLLSKAFMRSHDALIITSGLPLWQEIKLYWLLKQPPIPQRTLPVSIVKQVDGLRDNFILENHGFTGFEKFIRRTIQKQIPILYLEGYKGLIRRTNSLGWPSKPKFIFTSNSFDNDELFKVWTAEKTELGIPYIIAQHGANYGTGEYAPSENHEVSTADRYITWGWRYNNKKHYPVSALPYIGKTFPHCDPKGGLLLVERGGGQREHPWDELFLFKEYLKEQYRFIDELSVKIQSQTTVRLYAAHLYLSWSEDELWESKYPNINIDQGMSSMEDLIKQSRLLVYTYNSTGILESMAFNTPSIFFWDVEKWPFRDEAKKIFKKLTDVGIFHTSAISASNKTNEIWSDVEKWWSSDEVQAARMEFCNQHLSLSDNSMIKLKDALLNTKLNRVIK